MEDASIALATGDAAAAERALRAAIQSVQHRDNTERELIAALVKLGALKQEAGAHEEAEQLFRKALDVGEALFGPDHLGLVPVLSGLGAARIQNGGPGEAEQLLARALRVSENSLGADHPDLVILLNDLSRLYLNRSAPEAAEPLLLRLLALKRGKGEDHPEVATVLASLAAVQQALGRHEAAEQLWRRVLGIRERTLAPNHFAIATALEHLAEACGARGKVSEALQLTHRALAIRELTLGREHASVRVSRERIADLRLQESDERSEAARSVSPPLSAAPPPAPPAPPAPTFVPASAPVTVFAQLPQRPLPSHPTSNLSYLEVLANIQNELDAPRPEEQGNGRLRAWFAKVGERLRKPRSAAIAGGIIIVLPIAAFAAVSAARSRESFSSRSQSTLVALRPPSDTVLGGPLSSASEAPRRLDSLTTTLAGHAAPAGSMSEVGAGGQSSAGQKRAGGGTNRGGAKAETRPGGGGRSNGGESEENGGASASQSIPASVWTPSVSQAVSVRLDSAVRASSRGLAGESLPVQFKALLDSAEPSVGRTASVALRARLIGSMPSPRYPPQLLGGGRGGRATATDVRVRVDVDVTGRPVMSTFSVLGSPDTLLVAAVREVIPGMRFEPARSPWPASLPMVDRVELSFRFAVRVK